MGNIRKGYGMTKFKTQALKWFLARNAAWLKANPQRGKVAVPEHKDPRVPLLRNFLSRKPFGCQWENAIRFCEIVVGETIIHKNSYEKVNPPTFTKFGIVVALPPITSSHQFIIGKPYMVLSQMSASSFYCGPYFSKADNTVQDQYMAFNEYTIASSKEVKEFVRDVDENYLRKQLGNTINEFFV